MRAKPVLRGTVGGAKRMTKCEIYARSEQRERALQKHIHFRVSKADIYFCTDSTELYSCHKIASAI